MCSFGIRLENTNPPHFFCDRNASSFSTAPEKSVHAQTSAFGAGLSRTLLATYLPAFFVAGALCVVAALIVLAISRPPKPLPA
jgi:hypothetical protein